LRALVKGEALKGLQLYVAGQFRDHRLELGADLGHRMRIADDLHAPGRILDELVELLRGRPPSWEGKGENLLNE